MFTVIKKIQNLNLYVKLAVLFLIVLVSGGGIFVFRNEILSLLNLKKKISPLPEIQIAEEKTAKSKEVFQFEWRRWQDPAGFSFEYPKEVEINVHPEDEVNYSFLELTQKDKKGKIIVLCNDSQYSDIAEWLKKDELVKKGNGLATTVADMTAMKAALGKGREITGLIDLDNVIYTIDLDADDDWWREVYSHILDSFKLIPLEGESEEEFTNWLEDFDTSSADVVEPVEVIE